MIYDLDAELYDRQYDAYRDDVPFYLRLADELGGPVLELGAGSGRITEALLRAGHEVVAVDVSHAMLARAEQRLSGYGGVELVQADMRELSLGRQFPLILAPFNTLMHAYTVNDQDRTLAAVRAHLAPGGLFAFDLYLPNFGPMGVLRHEVEWDGVGGPGSELFLLQHHDASAQLVESRYYLDVVGEDGRLTRRSARLLQRYFHRFELERALTAAGLDQLRLFGDFGKGRLSAESALMVVLARVAELESDQVTLTG